MSEYTYDLLGRLVLKVDDDGETQMMRPDTSGTSTLSVRGLTVPWLLTTRCTSRARTVWTRTAGGGVSTADNGLEFYLNGTHTSAMKRS